MAIDRLEQLNDFQLDILREIGNIGSGNAITALSSMLTERIEMSVPRVELLDYQTVVDYMGGPEKVVIGILVVISGGMDGMLMYILQQNFARDILASLFNSQVEDLTNINQLEASALEELGNIMTGSYVNAISSLTGMEINISVPKMKVDMVGAMLAVPAVMFAEVSDKILFIEEAFLTPQGDLTSHILLMPEIDSLNKMMECLGV